MVRLSLKPLLCFLAAATLALAGCAPATRAPTPSTPSTSSQSVQPQAVQPNQSITLALLTPQSSPNQGAASLGRALVNSARMAMVDLNNRQVSLKVYDTGGDQARAAQQARTAIAEGADIILGPLFSASTRSVARVAGPQGIKVLSFSTDSSVAGNGVWLTGFLPEMEAKRILAFARSQGRGQVGVFHPANGYGEAALRGARAAERAGLTQIIGSGAFQPGFQGVQAASSGFAAEARGADAILLATGGRDLQAAGSFMNLNDFDPARVKYLGLGQWYSGATFQELSLQNGWFPAPDVGRSNQFSDRYARQFGAKPRLVAVLGYDAVRVAGQVFAEARRGGSTDPFPTQILTRPAGFEGGIGAIRFNQAGLSERALAVLEVSDRSFRTIDPAPARFRAGF